MVIKVCVVFLGILLLVGADNPPLILFGFNSINMPSLIPVRQTQFIEDVIKPIEQRGTIIVFMEKQLSTKDFLCGCFDHLQATHPKTYYASVENPVQALSSLNKSQEYYTIGANGNLEESLNLAQDKIFFINFDDREDFNKDRKDILREHDAAIAKIIEKYGSKAYYIYTGTSASTSIKPLTRQRRENIPVTDGYMYREGANLLIYFRSLAAHDGKNTIFLGVLNTIVKVENGNISVTMETNATKSLTFNIELSHGYFHMVNVGFDDKKFRSTEVNAPTTFSYFCGDLTLHRIRTEKDSEPYTLYWRSLQFQAPFNPTTTSDFIFGDAWHCVGFFSGGILMGLLIVVLLLTILFAGVCWMLDINTMDRFDDPKGKTININTNE